MISGVKHLRNASRAWRRAVVLEASTALSRGPDNLAVLLYRASAGGGRASTACSGTAGRLHFKKEVR